MTKKQIGFYADPDVETFLDNLDAGVKTRAINTAIRSFMESRRNMEIPAYGDTFESLIAWLDRQVDPIVVGTKSGLQISLAALLRKFFHQDRLRHTPMTWLDVVKAGITFPIPESSSEEGGQQMHTFMEVDSVNFAGYWQDKDNHVDKDHILSDRLQDKYEPGAPLYLAEKDIYTNELTGRMITTIILAADGPGTVDPRRVHIYFRIMHQCSPESCNQKHCIARGIATQLRPKEKDQLQVPYSPSNRCASCQKPLINPIDAINTPTRGRICRSCFEMPLPLRDAPKDPYEDEDMKRITGKS